jgi:hypothetical protein
MKLRGEPTGFGYCIREVRIACAHRDEGDRVRRVVIPRCE